MENPSLLRINNVRGQISKHIFAPMEAIVLIILHIFFATRAVLKIGEYYRTCLGQSRVSQNL